MPRGIPTAALAEQYAETTDGVWLVLLTVEHPDITTLRLVNNTTDIVSGGDTYTAFPFEPVFEPQTEGEMPTAKVDICNVDRSVVLLLRQVEGAATVTLEDIRAADPNTILSSSEFLLKRANASILTVTADLSPEPMLDEPYGLKNTPLTTPAIFRKAL